MKELFKVLFKRDRASAAAKITSRTTSVFTKMKAKLQKNVEKFERDMEALEVERLEALAELEAIKTSSTTVESIKNQNEKMIQNLDNIMS